MTQICTPDDWPNHTSRKRQMNDEQRFADFARIGADWLWETDSQDRFTYFSVATSQTGVELESRLGLRRRDGAAQDLDTRAHCSI